MDFSLSPAEKEIRNRAKAFVQNEMIPMEKEMPIDGESMTKEERKEVIQKAKEYNLLGVGLPKEYGGLGKSIIDRVLVQEQLYYSWFFAYGLVLLNFPPHPGLYGMSEAMKDKYLYPVIQGDKNFFFLFSEPEAGSDFASIKTTATRKGDSYVLNGMKMWSPDPAEADYVIVYATVDPAKGHKGITAFIVDRGTPGMNTVAKHKTMGEGGILGTIAEVKFDNCVIPAAYRLGEEGEGFAQGMEELNANRLWIVSGHIGRMQRCFDMAKEYAQKRITFGKPLSERQTIQWWLADSATDLHMARLMLYHGAWKGDQGKDIRLETAMAKAAIPEIGCRIIDRAIQIYGGQGYLKRTRLEAAYRFQRGARIAEGTGEIMRLVISRCLLQRGVSLEID